MTKWKLIYFGLGFVAGLGAASFFGNRNGVVRNAASSVLSYGMTAKRKFENAAKKAKDDIIDLASESEEKTNKRLAKDGVIVVKE
ncbi:MAG: hypothetical protein LBE27_04690 [Deltaproteobacteria bacterium]|jgi:hypothetical protein|nr:hypothetical protein [Deltaproteobacteria bacterium]